MSRPLSHRGLPLLLLVFFLHQELADAACTGPEYITACLQLAKAKTLESRCSEACKYGWGSQLRRSARPSHQAHKTTLAPRIYVP